MVIQPGENFSALSIYISICQYYRILVSFCSIILDKFSPLSYPHFSLTGQGQSGTYWIEGDCIVLFPPIKILYFIPVLRFDHEVC
jgi:hypothetical protein